MSGRIFFCGDVHGDFGPVMEVVRSHRPAAIVFLGDLEPAQPLERVLAPILDLTEVWWIPGNHDTDSERSHDHLFGSALAQRNLHGRVVSIDGIRVAGLGGVFRGQVWMPPGPARFASRADFLAQAGQGNRWRGGLPRRHRSSLFPEDCARLGNARADILVTHEAPSGHPHGFAAIDDVARLLQAGTVFHGHHHRAHDYAAHRARMGFEAHGVGLRGIVDRAGQVIAPGVLDLD